MDQSSWCTESRHHLPKTKERDEFAVSATIDTLGPHSSQLSQYKSSFLVVVIDKKILKDTNFPN